MKKRMDKEQHDFLRNSRNFQRGYVVDTTRQETSDLFSDDFDKKSYNVSVLLEAIGLFANSNQGQTEGIKQHRIISGGRSLYHFTQQPGRQERLSKKGVDVAYLNELLEDMEKNFKYFLFPAVKDILMQVPGFKEERE